MGNITKQQALEAYNTLRDYCKEQENCDDCLLSISEGILSEGCLMHLSEPPGDWQTLEIE